MTVGLAALFVASAWAVANEHIKALFVPCVVAALCVLVLYQRGTLIGLLLLTAMNGVPFFDTSVFVTGKLTIGDVAVIGLVLAGTAWILMDRSFRPSPTGRAVSRIAAILLCWWLFVLATTLINQHVSFVHAAAFGRDFVFFALLLMVLPRVRLTSRDINMLLGVLVVGVCLFAVGQIITAAGLGHVGGLIHFEKTVQQSGLTRVYADMTDLVTAGLAVSITASLIAPQPRVRRIARTVALLLTISVVVQLTRARWLGLVAGLAFVSLWLMINGETSLAATLRKRVTVVAGALGFAGLAAVLAAPGFASGSTIIQRLLSVFTDIETGGGSLAVRETVTRTMTSYLGGRWPVGLGFVPPSAHFFSGLPEGSLRDADVGVLNAVVTMGAVGAVLLYIPVILVLVRCLRRSSIPWTGRYGWLRYGGAVWIVGTLVSSATLVTLFTTSGLALTAVALTVLGHPDVSGIRLPAVTPDSISPKRDSVAVGLLERRSEPLPVPRG